MKKFTNVLGPAMLSAAMFSGAMLVAPAVAQAQVVVYAPGVPPPPRVEVMGPAPSPNHFWAPGVWRWEGGRHVWAGGRWEMHQPGAYYEPHRWEREGPRWRFREGGWRR